MAGESGMARKVALLLWAQTLGLAGAQTTQLLVEPPWRPAVLWDRVTLTCQGSGTDSATTWYRNGQHWGQEGRDQFKVTDRGIYQCYRLGSRFSPAMSILDDLLVLQVPARALLEGDTVTLHCRGRQDNPVTRVRFYRDMKDLGRSLTGTELSLSPLQLNHSGIYRCRGWVGSGISQSPPVRVKVHAPGPLRPRAPLLYVFHRDGQVVGGSQGSPQLLVPAVGVSHSGNYSCQVRSEGGNVRKSSTQLRITVRSECGDGHGVSPETPGIPCLVPVANATITPGPLAHQVHAGDNVTLCCSVQVGSAPVTFTWLHNGQEVAQGPLLELTDIDVGHSGTYQCVATNQLGQDGHRVFRALSPELALEVTPGSAWLTAARKSQDR
ncbi:Fc receptor-like protein 4 [Passer domesticus]|uniref:Fc receptor-like protein 4 n=1 Tax=Passer domesticus TaxID=48849 RepID=UPI0030FE04BB